MKKSNHYISLIKGISWRIVGTLDTMMLSYIFTGSIGNALKIGLTEVFTKVFLFYVHERIWLKIKWNVKIKDSYKELSTEEINQLEQNTDIYEEAHIRSIIKGISWRIVGTIDTIIIAIFWTGNYEKALKIGFTEVITKITLFYFHERFWMYILEKTEAKKNK